MTTCIHARRALLGAHLGMAIGLGLGGCAVAPHDGDGSEEASASSATELATSSPACGARHVSAERGRDVLPGSLSNDCRSHRTPCATVQHGVDAACAGDTVRVGAGVYVENIVISKSLTVEGSRGAVLRPALSAPRPCDTGSLCGGAASTIILVDASRVTLRRLTLDGDNPALTSGVVVGTADVDARNGIVTNPATVVEDLVVEDVRVDNAYLRGIQASQGGTFKFRRVDVRNVRGDAESVAVFNFASSGTITDSEVSDSADGFSSNHSLGTLFARNRVVRSASGVHSDNAGDLVTTVGRDWIVDNRVTDCAAGGFGAWVFAPFLAPFVGHNKVERCAVGLAAFGQGKAVQTPFVANRIRAGNEAGSVGAFVTTDQIGFGAANVSVLFLGNVFRGFETGVAVLQGTDGFVAEADLTCNAIEESSEGIVSATSLGRLSSNSITRNTLGLDATLIASGVLDAR